MNLILMLYGIIWIFLGVFRFVYIFVVTAKLREKGYKITSEDVFLAPIEKDFDKNIRELIKKETPFYFMFSVFWIRYTIVGTVFVFYALFMR